MCCTLYITRICLDSRKSAGEIFLANSSRFLSLVEGLKRIKDDNFGLLSYVVWYLSGRSIIWSSGCQDFYYSSNSVCLIASHMVFFRSDPTILLPYHRRPFRDLDSQFCCPIRDSHCEIWPTILLPCYRQSL